MSKDQRPAISRKKWREVVVGLLVSEQRPAAGDFTKKMARSRRWSALLMSEQSPAAGDFTKKWREVVVGLLVSEFDNVCEDYESN